MSRRSLYLLLVVVGGVVLLLYAVRGRGSTQGAKSATAIPATLRPGVHPTPTHPPIPHDVLQVRNYAVKLIPNVDRSMRAFNQLARQASGHPSAGGLNNTCTYIVKRSGVFYNLVDGIPHAFPWYSPAGRLHHRLLGTYHTMLEAAVACQTAAGNGDMANASISVRDINSAAGRLRAIDRQLHQLASQPR